MACLDGIEISNLNAQFSVVWGLLRSVIVHGAKAPCLVAAVVFNQLETGFSRHYVEIRGCLAGILCVVACVTKCNNAYCTSSSSS